MAKVSRKSTILLIIACIGVMLAAWPFQSAAEGGELQDTKSLADRLSISDPNQSGLDENTVLFLKMMLSVVLVVVLGVAALYVSKKVLPRLANAPGKRIRVVETAHLGPRRTVHLIEVDNHRMLVGSTNERITKLADITEGGSDFSVEYAGRIENDNDT